MVHQDVKAVKNHSFIQTKDATINAICRIKQILQIWNISVKMVVNVLILATNQQMKLVNIAYARFITEVSFPLIKTNEIGLYHS